MSAPVTGRRRRGRVPLIVLLVGLLMAVPMAAWGAWSSQAELDTVSASTGTVHTPQEFECSRYQGGLFPSVELSWLEPEGPAPDHYRIEARDSSGDLIATDTVSSDTRSIRIGYNLLEGLLSGLLSLLLDSETASLRVTAVHESGWESEPTAFLDIQGYTVLFLIDLGVECA